MKELHTFICTMQISYNIIYYYEDTSKICGKWIVKIIFFSATQKNSVIKTLSVQLKIGLTDSSQWKKYK